MPPKPLAEDLARKKAERDKQRKAEAALAVLEKPSGFEQTVNALKDPVGTVKQLGRVAKETFYDPSKRFAAAVDPNSGASVADRIAGVGEGVLYAADLLTLGVPEQALYREAMEKALDREVAGYAASGGGAKYRGVLGVHGSPVSGLTKIEARPGSAFLPDQPAAFNFLADQPTYPYDYERMMVGAENYGRRKLDDFGSQGSIYVTRSPRQSLIQEVPEDFVVSSTGSNVVGEVPINVRLPGREKARQLREAMFDVMTPAEKRAARQAALQRQLTRGQQERYLYNLRKEPGDF